MFCPRWVGNQPLTSQATTAQRSGNRHGCHKGSWGRGRLDMMQWRVDKWRSGPVLEGASPKEPDSGGWLRGGRHPDRSRNQLILRRLAILRRA
jgi:hypothetical protein